MIHVTRSLLNVDLRSVTILLFRVQGLGSVLGPPKMLV